MKLGRIILAIAVALSQWLPVAAAPLSSPPPDGQEVDDSSGSVFMEEVLPPAGKRKAGGKASVTGSDIPPLNGRNRRNLPIDLEGLGIKVDPAGNIIPLLNNRAPGAVQPLYSETSVEREIPYPVYGGPGGAVSWGPAAAPPLYAPSYSPSVPGFGFGFSLGRAGWPNKGWSPGGWNPGAGYYAYPATGIYPYAAPGGNYTYGLYNPGIGYGWLPPAYPAEPQAYRYLTPGGVSPWYTPFGPAYSGGWGTGPYGTGFAPAGNYLWLPGVSQYQWTSTVRPLGSGRFHP